ncbi:hypothetical protein JXA12_05785 [Candidatus Woesearchaeota archaeon]|nr:hypothetical protein [Candidatus Woesearchaeota archaeon]
MVYEARTFGAWEVEDDLIQIGILDYPIILSFTYEQLNSIRRDLSQLPDFQVYDDELRDFDSIRAYTSPGEEMVYVLFKELGGLSVGIPKKEFSTFCEELVQLNPQFMLEREN